MTNPEIMMGIWGSLIDGTLGKTARSFNRLASTPAQSRIDDEPHQPGDTLFEARGDQEPEPRVLLTELNVPLMLVPSAPTTETTATMIRANITAYSTAVGPSSLATKCPIRARSCSCDSFPVGAGD